MVWSATVQALRHYEPVLKRIDVADYYEWLDNINDWAEDTWVSNSRVHARTFWQRGTSLLVR